VGQGGCGAGEGGYRVGVLGEAAGERRARVQAVTRGELVWWRDTQCAMPAVP
jgi:hypothetical protein